MSKPKIILRWLSKRSGPILTALLFAIVVLLIFILTTGFSKDAERVMIGIAAVTTFLAAVSAIATLLQAVEVQRQRENLERPYVVVFFDSTSTGAIYFVIENSGNSPAVNIRIKFDPSPIDFHGRPLSEVSLFSNPISFLPASKVIRQIIGVGYKVLEEGRPTKYRVSVKYSSVFGDSYDEPIEFDLEYLRQATLPGKTIEDNLKNISEELGKLNGYINNAQGLNSFLVESPAQYSHRMSRLITDHA